MDYCKYSNMMAKIALSFSRTTGLPFEILKAESDFAFVLACSKYNDKCAFGTYLYNSITNHLCSFLTKEMHPIKEVPEMLRSEDEPVYERIFRKDMMEKASKGFHDMMEILIKNKYIFLSMNSTKAKESIRFRMLKKGYKKCQIDAIFHEAKGMVRQWT